MIDVLLLTGALVAVLLLFGVAVTYALMGLWILVSGVARWLWVQTPTRLDAILGEHERDR